MVPIVEPKVRNGQEPKVLKGYSNFQFMETTEIKSQFAGRLAELCDEMEIPGGRGRQSALAHVFKVSPNAARKWLLGTGLPELDLAIRIADWADVNVNWLLQGAGPKRGNRVDAKALVIDAAVKMLPREVGLDLVDNLRAKLERAGKLGKKPEDSHFATMLDAYEQEIGRKPN